MNDVKAGLITSRRIIFTPDSELKDELAKTAVQITCYDKDGKEVKRVTSTSGEVEDPENGTTESRNGGTNQNTNPTNGSDNQSSGESGNQDSGNTGGSGDVNDPGTGVD